VNCSAFKLTARINHAWRMTLIIRHAVFKSAAGYSRKPAPMLVLALIEGPEERYDGLLS
jgi:hypothetical protein